MTLVTKLSLTCLLALALSACGVGRSPMETPLLESVTPTWARNDAPALIEISCKDIGAAEVPKVYIGWNELGSVSCGNADAVAGIVPAGLDPGIWRLNVVLADGSLADGVLEFTVFPADRAP